MYQNHLILIVHVLLRLSSFSFLFPLPLSNKHYAVLISEPSKVISSAERPSTSLIEIKPPSTFSSDSPKTDIKPTKPVSKSTKQLSSVVRVVSAANPSPSIVNTSSKSLSSKVQIVSSHAEVIDENKSAAAHKSVVQVKAIGGNGDSHHPTTISASRIDVVAGISPIQSYVELNALFFSCSCSCACCCIICGVIIFGPEKLSSLRFSQMN